MANADSTNILQTQITTLQTLVTQLSADLNGLIAGCNARHRLNLTVEISRLENELKNLGKRIDDVENSVAVNYKSIGTITHDLTELVGRVNIVQLKITDIIEGQKRSRETKTNFIVEIIVIVLASIITGVIGFVASRTWSALSLSRTTISANNKCYKRGKREIIYK